MLRGGTTALALVASGLLGFLSASPAAGATVTIENLAQPGMLSLVPQAPVVLPSRGTCDQARGVEEANGGPSPCPAGTWPEQGSRDWFGGVVDVAVGDTLRLAFSDVATAVAATATTVYPVGLRTPPCPVAPVPEPAMPCANGDEAVLNTGAMLTPTATADPLVWTVAIPAPIPGIQIAVTATGPTGSANYAFGLSSPRWEDESKKCGKAFFAPLDARPACPAIDNLKGGPARPSDTVAPDPEPTPALAAPSLDLVRKPVLRRSTLTVATRASVGGRLTVTLRRRGVTLVRRTQTISAGASSHDFKLRRPVSKALAKHPKRRYTLKAELLADGQRSSATTAVTWRAR